MLKLNFSILLYLFYIFSYVSLLGVTNSQRQQQQINKIFVIRAYGTQ